MIKAKRPDEVAREVERLAGSGETRFVLAAIDHGGMLDQERLGAARYAAGIQSTVQLVDMAAAAAAAR
ncbi:MAG TPA: hypothetical protein VGE99_04420 [Candidatus Dormibacteraeota bacterium]